MIFYLIKQTKHFSKTPPHFGLVTSLTCMFSRLSILTKSETLQHLVWNGNIQCCIQFVQIKECYQKAVLMLGSIPAQGQKQWVKASIIARSCPSHIGFRCFPLHIQKRVPKNIIGPYNLLQKCSTTLCSGKRPLEPSS